MPTGARVHVRRRLPVSLNLPLFPRRYGLLFPLRRTRVSLRSRPRRARVHVEGPCTPAHAFCSSPFRSIIIVAQGVYARTSSRTSMAGEHCFIASSFAICHGIVFTIIINDHDSGSHTSRNVSCSAIKHR